MGYDSTKERRNMLQIMGVDIHLLDGYILYFDYQIQYLEVGNFRMADLMLHISDYYRNEISRILRLMEGEDE